MKLLNSMQKKMSKELNDFHEERFHAIAMLPVLIILTLLFRFGYRDAIAQSEVSQFPSSSFVQSVERAENKWDISAPYLKDGSWRQQKVIMDAWEISGGDKEFLLTLKAENGTFEPQRRSNTIGHNGHWDYGICQLNYQWHKNFIDSDNFDDTYKQIEYCYEVYRKRHGAFYGYYNRWKMQKFFIF